MIYDCTMLENDKKTFLDKEKKKERKLNDNVYISPHLAKKT